MHWEKEGAFTGEISPVMLKDLGIKYVIIGHSERRQFFGESNFQINKKLAAAFAYGLIPILCVGENRRQRDAGETEEVIEKQLNSALDGLAVEKDLLQKMVLAYEPVWAIGSGTPANGEEANVVAAFMRSLLLKKGRKFPESKHFYGGSVNPENIAEFTDKAEIDGALVGGSSLNVKPCCADPDCIQREENLMCRKIKSVFWRLLFWMASLRETEKCYCSAGHLLWMGSTKISFHVLCPAVKPQGCRKIKWEIPKLGI